MKLSSNRELYEYLLLLASQLERRGAEVLSKDVNAAARTANAFPATEFLGESRIALRRVLTEESGILSQVERADLLDVLKQLDAAFDRR
ncbi:MAG: hypothetical protein ACLQLC_17685 [Candidatus Sulfotelmatobacter sp.]